MSFSLTKSMLLKKIIICIIFLHFMHAIVCLTMNVIIKKIKLKIMFNSDVEINYMLKKLTNAVQLSVR